MSAGGVGDLTGGFSGVQVCASARVNLARTEIHSANFVAASLPVLVAVSQRGYELGLKHADT